MSALTEYYFAFYGNLGVRPLELVEKQINDEWARRWAGQNLPNYYPVYNRVVVWKENPGADEPVEIVADLKIMVTVVGAD